MTILRHEQIRAISPTIANARSSDGFVTTSTLAEEQ